jgi:hypothetical protein
VEKEEVRNYGFRKPYHLQTAMIWRGQHFAADEGFLNFRVLLVPYGFDFRLLLQTTSFSFAFDCVCLSLPATSISRAQAKLRLQQTNA